MGLTVSRAETVESEGVRVAFLAAGESRLELLEPLRPDSPVARFLDRRGEGIHHVTFEVDHLRAFLERARGAGVEVLDPGPRPGAGGSRVAFLHPRSCGGILVELSETPRAGGGGLAPGDAVLVSLREPQEKLWGLLRRLDATGLVLEGLDLASFDDWAAQVERHEPSVVGPSVIFLPMARVERILLDRASGELPSLAERFMARTGRSVRQVLGGGEGT